MQSNEKTFRYTYILKNLGVVYLLFLAIGFWITFAFDGPVFFIFVFLGVGVLGIIIYVTTSVTVFGEEISGRTLMVSRALRWSEIGSIKSTSSSFKLVNIDGDITIRVNARMDGYAEILDLLYQKRGDLFDANKFKSFSKSITALFAGLISYCLLFLLSMLRLVFGRDWESAGFSIVFGLLVFYMLKGLFFTPKNITLEADALTLQYFRKTNSYLRDNIASILFSGSQVSIILKNNSHIVISGFSASPIVIYFVLRRWHQKPAQPSTYSNATRK